MSKYIVVETETNRMPEKETVLMIDATIEEARDSVKEFQEDLPEGSILEIYKLVE